MEDWTKARAVALGSGGIVGAVAALFLFQPPRWDPLPKARLAAVAEAAAAAPTTAAVVLDAGQAARARAFPDVRERAIVLGQELRRVEGQVLRQRTAYDEFVRRNTPFDLPAWHQRQKELAEERAALEVQLKQANAEYERYLCDDGLPRPECWH